MKTKTLGKIMLIGAALYALLELTGINDIMAKKTADKLWDLYHNSHSSAIAAEEGTAYFNVFDRDGLDSIVISNNTSEDDALTQIPPIKLQNLYAENVPFSLGNLKPGHYTFTARVRDDLGNLETRTFDLDIQNPNGGAKTLYGAQATIQNNRLPDGKESFSLD